MAKRSLEIVLGSNDGCEKSDDKVYADPCTAKKSYMEEYKSEEIWSDKDEETLYLESNRKLENISNSFQSNEEILNERKENTPSPLHSEKGSSEKINPNFEQTITNESSCQDSDMKPTHSYIALIAMAILSSSSKKMILGDIKIQPWLKI